MMSIENLLKEKVEEYNLHDKVSITDNSVKWENKGWEFTLPNSINGFHRRILTDIFPFSPYAIKREEMWGSVISGLLKQNPEININSELIDNLIESQDITYKGNDEEVKESLKAIFEDLYYIESKSARKVPYILPFHLQIIGNLRPKEPRGFNNLFRLLLTDKDGQFDQKLFDNVIKLFSDEDSLNPIDKLFLKTLKQQPKYKKIEPIMKHDERTSSGGYDFNNKQGELFRRDLRSILEMKISRIEKVRYFTVVMGLHFSVYVIRISYYLDWEFNDFNNSLNEKKQKPLTTKDYDQKFSSKLTFTFEEQRTPKSSNAVINCNEMSQTVYKSYIHMVLLNTIRHISGNQILTFRELLKKIKLDEQFNQWINLCFELLMISYCHQVIKLETEDEIRKHLQTLPGGNIYKRYEQLVTKHFATQKSSNRTPKTAGINFIKQSMGVNSNYSFIAKKPGVSEYYGIGKDLIILLVHLTIDVDEKKIRYKDFLNRISAYGFKPDQHAENTLLKKLEETGLLQKFSDSGEAMYVRKIF